MTGEDDKFTEWIDEFHEKDREHQIERMEWIDKHHPNTDGYRAFHGGFSSSNLYEEAQQAYLFGLFQTSMISALSVVEQELIGILYGAGDDEIKEKGAAAAIDEAASRHLITPEQKQVLHRVRKVRNPTAHFRLGVDDDSLEARAINQDTAPFDLMKEEAQTALKAMFSVIGNGDEGLNGYL
ncbi:MULTISPECIES: hypothetical protein [Halorubrum]|jgi:hypothetical protein|uniref:hypothetical protein n=1 Tax=Halorubrum TaxID=56688 RepID=UPI0011A71533|nr:MULTISPECIES: hypothetical protein [Halorubrum]